ncbi:divalent-cation tolerance protein CutA [Promicromonospora sukumoe]|uniref:divalent-cation tolerance protein CutA n=1 Tax=Promicromonospora sukumoe TaxID=88382 RepID=UPI0037CBC031
MTDQEFCQAVVTFDDREKGEALARTIVGERLAACAQIDGPITSVFWWEGAPQTEEEWRVEFKTRTTLLDELTAKVAELHDYDVPQVVAVPIVGGLPAYLDWMREETREPASAERGSEETVTG